MKKKLSFISLASLLTVTFLFSTVLDTIAQSNGRNSKSQKITICHIPPGNPDNAHTIIIDQSAWEAHAAHGDSKGVCKPDRKNWRKADKITICHFPPGNPDNVQNITIAEEAWEAHAAHGDAIGDDCAKGDDDDNGGGSDDDGDDDDGDDDDGDDDDGDDDDGDDDDGDDDDGDDDDGDDDDGDDDDDTTNNDCNATISANFNDGGLSVTAISDKDLSHVVIIYCDDVEVKFEDLSGNSMTFEGSGDNEGKLIKGIWIKSGCNSGDNHPSDGEYVANDNFDGTCNNEEEISATLETEDEEICLGDNTTLSVQFTGQGPWTLFYQLENESFNIAGIENSEYELPVSESGLYVLTGVSDVNGNEGEAIGEVEILAPPTAQFEKGGSVCEGEQLELRVNLGGSGPWTFSYEVGGEIKSASSEESIAYITTSVPGEYRITRVSNGNCESTGSEEIVVVEEIEVGTVEISGGGDIYDGESTSIDFNMTGQGPWTIVYTDGNEEFSFETSETSYSVEVSDPGIYSIVSADGASCVISSGQGEVVVYELPTAELIIEDPEICADEDQTLVISFTGSGPWDLTYSVDGENVVINDIQTADFSTEISESGVYKVENVTDINEREGRVSGEFDVNISEVPFATIDGGGSICPGEEAEIKINLGGDGPWNFTYNNGTDDITVDSDEPVYQFSTTEPGEYRIKTITSGNCSISIEDAVAVVEVNEVSTVDISGGGNFYAGQEATLEFDMTGQGPWTIEYSNGNSSESFTTADSHYEINVTEQGDYKVTAIEAGGCSFESTGEVTVYELSTATMTSDNQIICEGQEGFLEFALTGNGPWNVTYSIDGTNYTETGIDDNQHRVLVTDGSEFRLVDVEDINQQNGRATGSTEIDFQALPSATLFGGGMVCEGEQAQIRMDLTGTGPWTINYSDGSEDYSVTTSDRSYTLSSGTEGDYSILSVSNGRCENASINAEVVTIDVIEQPTATITGSAEICESETTALTVDLTGEGPWTFDYTDGSNSFSVTTDDSQYQIPASNSGNYVITNVSSHGCSNGGTGNAVIGIIESIASQGTLITEDTHCQGSEIFIELEIPNGTEYDITWSSTGGGDFSATNNTGAIYVPSDTDESLTFVATVTNRCETVSFSANTLVEKINSAFDIERTGEEMLTNVEYRFNAASNDGDSYQWSFDGGSSDAGTSSSYKFTESGSHTVSLTVARGECESTSVSEFLIVPNTNLYVPSVFNPESTNPENSKVRVYGEDVAINGFSFEIRNRWGLIVYRTDSFEEAKNTGWNGTKDGEPQENGVYSYILIGSFNGGDPFERTGTVTLIK